MTEPLDHRQMAVPTGGSYRLDANAMNRAPPPRSRFQRRRKVLIVKFLLPLIAIGLVGLVLTWPQLQSNEDEFRLEPAASVGGEQAAKPQVLNPRLSGVDEDGQPFEITADIGTATIGEQGTEVYYLTRPKADVVLHDGGWIALTAADGIYEAESETLTLRDGVHLFHDSGIEFQTEQAEIKMNERAAEGHHPVFGFGDFGEIESEGFRILDRGDRIIFTGRAQLLIANDGATFFAHPQAVKAGNVAETQPQ